MSHDGVYVLDSNLAVAYKQKSIPGWNEFADEHVKLGKKMYVVSISSEEVVGGLPSFIETLRTDQPITREGMEPFYKTVLSAFNCTDATCSKLMVTFLNCSIIPFLCMPLLI